MHGAPAVAAAQPTVRPIAYHQLDQAQFAGHAEALQRGLPRRWVELVDVDPVGCHTQKVFQVVVAGRGYGGVETGLERQVDAAAMRGRRHRPAVIVVVRQGGFGTGCEKGLQPFLVHVTEPATELTSVLPGFLG